MLHPGRPRTTNTELPIGLRHSPAKGFFYYGSHIINGKRSYKHIGKVELSKALAIWEKLHKKAVAKKEKKEAFKNELRKCKKCGLLFKGQRCQPCNTIKMSQWRKNNPDKAKAMNDSWVEKNQDRVIANNARWVANNKYRITELAYLWRKANPGKVRASSLNRRARQLASGGNLSTNLANKLFKLQNGKCPCCGLPLGTNYHMDHIMPLVLGGSNTDDNIQLLRARCNLQKNAKHPVDFMQQRGFLL